MLEHVRSYAPSLMDNGLTRVLNGATSLDEVVRVTRVE
jgi:type II secretory ATPase GspE/PulE/Tfp pilus assembly ATPase PilB-like protein